MSVEIRVPSVGESVSEGEIAQWFKKVGDFVSADEPVCSIETDKVAVDVPSPASGIITELRASEGDVVEVGAVLALLEERSSVGAMPPAPAQGSSAPSKADTSGLGPAARRLVEEHGLDLAAVDGTGKGGRVRKGDLLPLVAPAKPERSDGPLSTALIPPPAAAKAPSVVPVPVSATGFRGEERVAMTPLRRRVAQRLVAAQQNAAILTTFNEVDMSGIMALRQRYQDDFVKKNGIKLGFMSFFVKAAVEALKAFPAVNAEVDGDEIVYKAYFDIGVAVGGGRGLVVPVIRNAERLSFGQIEQTIADFGQRAKINKLAIEELQGGTFTISNGGVYGSMLSTPILNPPQSGILGMHNIQKRAVVVDDQITIRPMMYVALSYDHRIIDGREAVSFLVRIKECIETPERMLLEI